MDVNLWIVLIFVLGLHIICLNARNCDSLNSCVLAGNCDSDILIEPSSGFIVQGDVFSIRCSANKHASQNVPMYIWMARAKRKIPETQTKILEDGSIIAYLNSTFYGTDNYQCVVIDSNAVNGCKIVASKDINIGSIQCIADYCQPPHVPGIHVSSRYHRSMNVSWCGHVDHESDTKWRLMWTITQLNLTDECEVYGADGCSCHVCQWTDRGLISRYGCTKKQFFTFQSYNFTLTGTNDYGSTTSTVHVHTDLTIVEPHHVTELVSTYIDSSSLSLSWCAPNEFPMSITERYEATYMITINSTNQCQTPSQFTRLYTPSYAPVPFNGTISGPCRTQKISYTPVNTHLHPSVTYDVSVQAKPIKRGYWSLPEVIRITTNPDVPLQSPVIPEGIYLETLPRHQCTDDITEICRTIHLFWKSIPTCELHGRPEDIYVELLATSETHMHPVSAIVRADKRIGLLELRYHHAYSIKLFAFNMMVRGDEHNSFIRATPNSINIPLSSEAPKSPEIFAEYDSAKDQITVRWMSSGNPDYFMFFWCLGSGINCEHDINTIKLLGQQRAYTFQTPNSMMPLFGISAIVNEMPSGMDFIHSCIYLTQSAPGTPTITYHQTKESSLLFKTKDVCSPNIGRVTRYKLQYCVHGHCRTEYYSSAADILLNHLSEHTTYNISLYAINDVGESEPFVGTYSTMSNEENDDNRLYMILPIILILTLLCIIGGCIVIKRKYFAKVVIEFRLPEDPTSGMIIHVGSTSSICNLTDDQKDCMKSHLSFTSVDNVSIDSGVVYTGDDVTMSSRDGDNTPRTPPSNTNTYFPLSSCDNGYKLVVRANSNSTSGEPCHLEDCCNEDPTTTKLIGRSISEVKTLPEGNYKPVSLTSEDSGMYVDDMGDCVDLRFPTTHTPDATHTAVPATSIQQGQSTPCDDTSEQNEGYVINKTQLCWDTGEEQDEEAIKVEHQPGYLTIENFDNITNHQTISTQHSESIEHPTVDQFSPNCEGYAHLTDLPSSNDGYTQHEDFLADLPATNNGYIQHDDLLADLPTIKDGYIQHDDLLADLPATNNGYIQHDDLLADLPTTNDGYIQHDDLLADLPTTNDGYIQHEDLLAELPTRKDGYMQHDDLLADLPTTNDGYIQHEDLLADLPTNIDSYIQQQDLPVTTDTASSAYTTIDDMNEMTYLDNSDTTQLFGDACGLQSNDASLPLQGPSMANQDYITMNDLNDTQNCNTNAKQQDQCAAASSDYIDISCVGELNNGVCSTGSVVAPPPNSEADSTVMHDGYLPLGAASNMT